MEVKMENLYSKKEIVETSAIACSDFLNELRSDREANGIEHNPAIDMVVLLASAQIMARTFKILEKKREEANILEKKWAEEMGKRRSSSDK